MEIMVNFLCYLQFQTGQLNEYKERKEMPADVVCMALANAPSGEQMSRFLAVGLKDKTVRIISLDPSVSKLTIYLFNSLSMSYGESIRNHKKMIPSTIVTFVNDYWVG